MEEINLKDLFSYFISKLSLMAIIAVFVGILGCIYAIFLQTPMYNSYTTLVLTRVSDENSSLTANDITINSKLVGTYSEIIKSSRIMNAVIEKLDLDYTADQLKKTITVTNINNTELIKISVNTDDPSLSSDIANEIAGVFSEEIVDIYSIQNLAIIDKAIPATNPYNINILKQVAIYLAAGVVLAFVVVFIIYYFDNKIKSVEEVEQKIGLPILGSVPNRTMKKKKSTSKGAVKK